MIPSGAVGGELSVLIAVSESASVVDRAGEAMNSQSPPSFHGPLVSISPSSPVPVEIIEELEFTRPGVGASLPIEKAGFFMLSRAAGKGFHVGDFAGHKKLQRIFGTSIVAEIDQPLINDFGAGFSGDIAAKVNVELTRNLQISRRSRHCPAS